MDFQLDLVVIRKKLTGIFVTNALPSYCICRRCNFTRLGSDLSENCLLLLTNHRVVQNKQRERESYGRCVRTKSTAVCHIYPAFQFSRKNTKVNQYDIKYWYGNPLCGRTERQVGKKCSTSQKYISMDSALYLF